MPSALSAKGTTNLNVTGASIASDPAIPICSRANLSAQAFPTYAKSVSGRSGACSSAMSCLMLRTSNPPVATNPASISNPYE
jgi:hypothetical protein